MINNSLKKLSKFLRNGLLIVLTFGCKWYSHRNELNNLHLNRFALLCFKVHPDSGSLSVQRISPSGLSYTWLISNIKHSYFFRHLKYELPLIVTYDSVVWRHKEDGNDWVSWTIPETWLMLIRQLWTPDMFGFVYMTNCGLSVEESDKQTNGY